MCLATTNSSNKQKQTVFWAASVVFLFIKYLTFKGFNGSDDLHYAMLASKCLQGSYSPFLVTDIFSGRCGLIYTQSLFYYMLGITDFSTQLPVLIITVISCYQTIFKLCTIRHIHWLIFYCCIFYSNPTLNEATIGILPDVYVLFALLQILVLSQRFKLNQSTINTAIIISLIAALALLFKENAFIFLPFFVLMAIFRKQERKLWLSSAGFYLLWLLIIGLLYWACTNSFWFKISQINSANYVNDCTQSFIGMSNKIKRLTYGVFYQSLSSNFIALCFPAIFLLFIKKYERTNFYFVFVLLLMLVLFFPFSFTEYQPLCHKPRHYLFILPVGIAFMNNYEKRKKTCLLIASFVLVLTVSFSASKLYWLANGMIVIFFIATCINKNTWIAVGAGAVIVGSMLQMLLPYWYNNHTWYNQLKQILANNKTTSYLFVDHDNYTHTQLLHHFDSSYQIYNLEQKAYPVFKQYYKPLPANIVFPATVIINRKYTSRSVCFLKKIDSAIQQKNITAIQKTDEFIVWNIDNDFQLQQLQKLVIADEGNYCKCY